MLITTETTLHSDQPVQIGDFILRPALREEIGQFVELGKQYDQEITGISNFNLELAESQWDDPHNDFKNNFRFVIDPASGKAVAYGEVMYNPVMPVRPWGFAFVSHPYHGHGIGEALARWAVERAKLLIEKAPENARVVLQNAVYEANTAAAGLLKSVGYHLQRSSYTMLITMDEAPPASIWPEGITLTNFKQTPDLARFASARAAGFKDHRGYVPTPLDIHVERWQRFIDADAKHDPELYVLAMDGETPAGIMIGEYSDEYEDTGWVDALAVLPDYRRKGLGLALLHHAFGLYWQREIKSVGLGVDGSSLTNAVALYERAGMHIDKKYDIYEMELRPGEELTPQ
jgi:GNAT superfamily N-acetyltransferase